MAKRRSRFVNIFIAIGLCLQFLNASCSVMAPAPKNSPREVLEDFVKAYNNSDAVKMASLVQGGNLTYDYGWTKGKSANILTITDIKVQIDGNRAQAEFTLEEKIAKTGFITNSGRDSINLVVEGGRWQIEKPDRRESGGQLSDLAIAVVNPVELDQEAKSSPTLNKDPDAILVGLSRAKLIVAIEQTKPKDLDGCPPWGYDAFHEGVGSYILFPAGQGDELYFLFTAKNSVLSHWVMVNGKEVLKSQQRLSKKGSCQKRPGALFAFMLEHGFWFGKLPPKAQMLGMEKVDGLAVYQEDEIAINYYCWAILQNRDKTDFISPDDPVIQDSPEAVADGFHVTKQERDYIAECK